MSCGDTREHGKTVEIIEGSPAAVDEKLVRKFKVEIKDMLDQTKLHYPKRAYAKLDSPEIRFAVVLGLQQQG